MAFSVQMPALGESVTEGTVTRWLKQEGDTVEVDEPLLEVSTDKVDTEIPSPAAGILERIVAAEDEVVEVGAELAVIGDGASGGSVDSAGSDASGGDTPASSAVEAPAEEQADADAPPAPPNRAAEPAAEMAPEPEVEQAPPAPSGGGGSGGGSAGGDATPVVMPALGESVTEGTVTRWLKQVGDTVAVDEPLLEVSTDKVDTEIPSPVAGTLLEITAGEDETVDVGGQLAVIGSADAAPARSEPEPEPARAEQPAAGPAHSAPEPAAAAPEEPAAPEAVAVQDQEQARREDVAAAQPAPDQAAPDQAAPGQAGDADGEARTGAPYVTPLVRKLAGEHDVDLSTITGSGVGGRIRKQDVLAAAEAARTPEPAPQPAPEPSVPASAPARTPAAAPAGGPQPGTTAKLPRLRQVIAERMTESLRVSAQLTTVQEVDVTRIARLRARAKGEFERREGVKLTFLPFFAKATVEALKQFPALNASIDADGKQVTYHASVHLAIAVDTPRGLLVPVVKGAEDLNIAGLAKRIADVAARTRESKIGPDELSGGTFTITNIGSAGALFDTPIINQPQVAILGTGKITKQPAVITGPDGDDVIAIRSVCYLPLTYDHRLVDGADAGRFVTAIRERLEEGAFESDLGL
ncbi:MAG: 2-oxoglutarate dehydrogenase, E2 component, dihydrolipoamide succinyltransferase [Pseudonocardia sp.]